jgi:ElaB/YqjD/DUF883 family membrane-anchored ribosome-binding protein
MQMAITPNTDIGNKNKVQGGLGQSEGQSAGKMDTKTFSRPDSIDEALKVLDKALGEHGKELKDLVTDDYKNLKTAISGIAEEAGISLSGVTDTVKDFGGQAYDRITDFTSDGLERGKKLAADVDAQVKANPWPVIGGVALGTFAIGFLVGRKGSRD